jgi:hypothetical protein
MRGLPLRWQLALLIGLLTGCSKPDLIARGKLLIEEHIEMIAFLAHPTATFQSAEYAGCRNENGGFRLLYRLDFESDLLGKSPFHSMLGFMFDKDGRFQRSTVESTTASVKPYVAATRARAALPYDFIARELFPAERKRTDPQQVQDFILQNGGAETFRKRARTKIVAPRSAARGLESAGRSNHCRVHPIKATGEPILL